jgi:hypothetical protein
MALSIGLLIALWLAKKLLQYARQALNNARYRHQISNYIKYSEIDSDPDYIPDPDYDFPVEKEADPEKEIIINERIERLNSIIHDNLDILQAIETELKTAVKPSRITALKTKYAAVNEKIFRLEKQIDKERESL